MFKKMTIILLVCVLLCGCSMGDIEDKLPKKTYTQGDVSIELPTTFKNYSSQNMAEGKDFLFANNEIGITGVKESKEVIYETFEVKDLEGYANLIAEVYELDTTASKIKGYWSFTYEQEVDGKDYTYLCVFHETSSDYWNIQAYCETSEFEEMEDTLWDYATEIEIADNGNGDKKKDPTEAEPTEEDPTEADPTEAEPTETDPEDPTEAEQGVVTIDIPDDFLDYSNTTLASGYAFMYANEDIGIIGVQENKEELYLYFEEMDLEGYANLIAELYALENPAEEKDGFWTVSYTDDSTGISFTYIGVFYETEADFWHIQAYCMTEQYEEFADDIWQYITSAKFAEN